MNKGNPYFVLYRAEVTETETFIGFSNTFQSVVPAVQQNDGNGLLPRHDGSESAMTPREREREGGRENEMDREIDREIDRENEIDRERTRERVRENEIDRERERERERENEKERERMR